MAQGFDAATDCSSIAATVAASELYDFICRYYGGSPSKDLTASEARAISKAGLQIVAVWEANPKYDTYFSHVQGVNEGTSAYYAASSVGQPAGSAIYFAVDYDAGDAAINGPITDYFRGIADGFAAAGGRYRVGVYGSGNVCSAILAADLATFAWLAGGAAWGGSAGFVNWNIKQSPSGATILGVGVDLDQATENYGCFTV